MNRWLKAFDVRLAKGNYVDRWDDPTRREYLLNPDVEWPLSIDTWVWPSVFFWNSFRPTWDLDATIPVDAPDYGLHLDRMRSHYDANRGLAPDAVFVAIELLSEKRADGEFLFYDKDGGIGCGIRLDPTEPDRLPESSTLLGFDVATAGGTSGLCDCGYTSEEVAELAPVWAPRLNPFGLLTTLEDAVEFRELSERRSPEDAPFWIYALWRLPIP